MLLTFSWVGVFSYTLNGSINGATVQEVEESPKFNFLSKIKNSKMFEDQTTPLKFPNYANNFMYLLSLMSIFVMIIGHSNQRKI